MIFNPQQYNKTEGQLCLFGKVDAKANPCLNKDIMKSFWHNFSFQSSTLSISECEEFIFSTGNVPPLPLDGFDYSINIEPAGVCVYAEGEQELIRGFMTLLDRFEAIDCEDKTAVKLDCCQIRDSARIQNRMVHFCIFPETELWELQRFVRLCGALKYTHIVLEFWGMLKYDCMKELSWSHGFTKEQIRPIIKEAHDLGMEIIPMFNHWGHASAGRVMHGKHVVLDQNPSLQTYFSADGWCWDIRKPKVKELLRRIRNELIELCGQGGYFHIGCDEAYNFEFTEENMDMLCGFINDISSEMLDRGRRIIVWGDMMLYRYEHYNPKNRYSCNAPTPEVEQYMLNHLNKDIILADWQYDAYKAPVETVSVFKEKGFDCLLCPWDRGVSQAVSSISTVTEMGIMGFMHTTWHTLSAGMPHVTLMAIGGYESIEAPEFRRVRTHTAALLRKVMPVNGDYAKAGWSKFEISCSW